MLDQQGQLVETCMFSEIVQPGKVGCPMVFLDKNNRTYLELLHSACPQNNSRCPQLDHPGYSTNELYKYPVCFVNISERFVIHHITTIGTDDRRANSNSSPEMNQGVYNTVHFVVPIAVNIAAFIPGVIFVSIVFILINRKMKRQENIETSVTASELQPLSQHENANDTESVSKLLYIINDSKLEELQRRCVEKTYKKSDAMNTLILAAQFGQKEYVQCLVQSCESVDFEDSLGLNLLHYCIIHNWKEIFTDALKKCPHLLDYKPAKKGTSFILYDSEREKEKIRNNIMKKEMGYTFSNSDNDVSNWQEYRIKVLRRGLDNNEMKNKIQMIKRNS